MVFSGGVAVCNATYVSWDVTDLDVRSRFGFADGCGALLEAVPRGIAATIDGLGHGSTGRDDFGGSRLQLSCCRSLCCRVFASILEEDGRRLAV